MELVLGKITAGLIPTLVILVVYLHFHIHGRHIFYFHFLLAWCCHDARHIIGIFLDDQWSVTSPFVHVYVLLAFGKAYLISLGTHGFISIKIARWPLLAYPATQAFALTAKAMEIGSWLQKSPPCWMVGWLLVSAGRLCSQSPHGDRITRSICGVTLGFR